MLVCILLLKWVVVLCRMLLMLVNFLMNFVGLLLLCRLVMFCYISICVL